MVPPGRVRDVLYEHRDVTAVDSNRSNHRPGVPPLWTPGPQAAMTQQADCASYCTHRGIREATAVDLIFIWPA